MRTGWFSILIPLFILPACEWHVIDRSCAPGHWLEQKMHQAVCRTGMLVFTSKGAIMHPPLAEQLRKGEKTTQGPLLYVPLEIRAGIFLPFLHRLESRPQQELNAASIAIRHHSCTTKSNNHKAEHKQAVRAHCGTSDHNPILMKTSSSENIIKAFPAHQPRALEKKRLSSKWD